MSPWGWLSIVLIVDRGREREHIDFFGTQQRAFGNAVGLERRAYEG
jgi:hypothetical protein